MNMKPVLLATMLGIGAVSITAMSGCAGRTANDTEDLAAAAAPPPAPVISETPAVPDSAASAAPAETTAAAEPIVPDAALTAKVKAALAKKLGNGAHIAVSVKEGVVRLSGAVASSVQIDQAQYVVGEIAGVREIDNRLKAGRQ